MISPSLLLIQIRHITFWKAHKSTHFGIYQLLESEDCIKSSFSSHVYQGTLEMTSHTVTSQGQLT